ncbi:hypothetical protein, partial [Escherichia coli]|uniref:hypothetical protein n=1 Tax=Escherichia coli TaxID=562 RepID=UPI0005C46D2D
METSAIKAAASLKSPWFDAANAIASMSHLTELGSIGKAINLSTGYSDAISDALRQSLGDWRDASTVDQNILRNLSERTTLYTDRGLDPDLTDFPEEAFEESLDVFNIRGVPPD